MKLGLLSLLATAATLLLTGCASTGNLTQIPGGARLVAESPAPLVYTADAPGTVYVRDRTTSAVVKSARLTPGQKFEMPVPAGAAYEVFFKAAEKREYHPSYNP
ncbi:MAG: hypothetical protein ACAI43_25645 [Phycisphaerae bacterium]